VEFDEQTTKISYGLGGFLLGLIIGAFFLSPFLFRVPECPFCPPQAVTCANAVDSCKLLAPCEVEDNILTTFEFENVSKPFKQSYIIDPQKVPVKCNQIEAYLERVGLSDVRIPLQCVFVGGKMNISFNVAGPMSGKIIHNTITALSSNCTEVWVKK